MEGLQTAIVWISLLAYAGTAIFALRMWRHNPSRSTRAFALTFSSLALVVVSGQVTGAIWGEDTPAIVSKITVGLLAMFPYFLLRFSLSFPPRSRRLRRAADISLAVVLAATAALPELPDAGESGGAFFNAFLVLFLVHWLWPSIVAVRRFWRAGADQPTVVRSRVRLLAVAAGVLALALVITASVTSEEGSAVAVAVQLLSLGAALAFFIGVAPPRILRVAWRVEEEAELQRAALKLMAARKPTQVTAILLPHTRALTGASAAVMLSEDGTLLGSDGDIQIEDIEALRFRQRGLKTGHETDRTLLVFPLTSGTLGLWAGPYTPLFGSDERALVSQLGLLADLALDRTSLLESERQARAQLESANQALEAANDELESFVYSASHDLKNPLIAMLGYLEMLREDYAEELGDDGRLYLDRMTINGTFMEELIGDLLALSRVGRVDVEPAWTDLEEVAANIRPELTMRAPSATLEVGDLPQVHANPTRLRQLVTNLVDNAVKYGDREDVTIELRSERHDGEVHLVVKDDGVGIPEDYRERIFGVFERLEVDEERKSGTGIGLAICRKIVDGFGGRIWVAPSPVGAEFRIAVPEAAVRFDGADRSAEGASPSSRNP